MIEEKRFGSDTETPCQDSTLSMDVPTDERGLSAMLNSESSDEGEYGSSKSCLVGSGVDICMIEAAIVMLGLRGQTILDL